MIVCAARNDCEPGVDKRLGKDLRIFFHALLIGLKLWRQRFAKRHGLRGNHMHERAALHARENGRVELFTQIFVIA